MIIGYRLQVAKVLEKLQIPFAIWSEKPLKNKMKKASFVFISPIPKTASTVRSQLLSLRLKNQPSHIIAGTENGVMAAHWAREYFGLSNQAKEELFLRCTDKIEMKNFLSKAGVAMTDFLPGDAPYSNNQVCAKLDLPVVVKDRVGSGGRNLCLANSPEELQKYRHPSRILEKFIDAKEGSVESFIQNDKIIFANLTQYFEKKIANIVPGSFSVQQKSEILRLNQQVISALGISSGMTHLEFYMTHKGPVFGEIAIRPPGGYLMDLIELSYGFNPWEIFTRLELFGATSEFPIKAAKYSAAYIIHPGEGMVERIVKPKKADFASLKKISLRVKSGGSIAKRQSVGEECGHCLFATKSKKDLLADLRFIQKMPMIYLKKPA